MVLYTDEMIRPFFLLQIELKRKDTKKALQ